MMTTVHSDLLQPAILATVEAFQAHANLTARPGKPMSPGSTETFSTEVRVFFRLTGAVRGRMELCFSKATAIRLGATLSDHSATTLNDLVLEGLRFFAREWSDCARTMGGAQSAMVSPPELFVSTGSIGTLLPEDSDLAVPFHFALGEFTLRAELRREPEIFP